MASVEKANPSEDAGISSAGPAGLQAPGSPVNPLGAEEGPQVVRPTLSNGEGGSGTRRRVGSPLPEGNDLGGTWVVRCVRHGPRQATSPVGSEERRREAFQIR